MKLTKFISLPYFHFGTRRDLQHETRGKKITDSTSDQNVGLPGRIKFVISLQINENICSDEKVFSTCFILIFGLILLQIIDSTSDQNDMHLGYFNALLICYCV